MDFNRLVINVIKQSFSDYVSTGHVEKRPILDVINNLNIEIDQLTVENKSTKDIIELKSDLEYILYDLFYE